MPTEERREEEALDLDPLAAELLDREDGHIVPGDEPERRDDQVPHPDLEQLVPRGPGLAVEPDLLQHDVLVEVHAVERDVEQEPAHARPDEHLQVPPLREVLQELAEVPALRRRVVRRAQLVVCRCRLGRVFGLDRLLGDGGVRARLLLVLLEVVDCLFVLNARGLLTGLLVARGLRERQALVEGAERGDERQADEDTPNCKPRTSARPSQQESRACKRLVRTAIDLARLAVDLHRLLITQEDDDERKRADERAPALVGENVREERAAALEVRAVRRDGRGHGVVAPYAYPEDYTPHPEPDECAVGRQSAWRMVSPKADLRNCSILCRTGGIAQSADGGEDDEHELLAVWNVRSVFHASDGAVRAGWVLTNCFPAEVVGGVTWSRGESRSAYSFRVVFSAHGRSRGQRSMASWGSHELMR